MNEQMKAIKIDLTHQQRRKKYLFCSIICLTICEFLILWSENLVGEALVNLANRGLPILISIWGLILIGKLASYINKENKKWYEYIFAAISLIIIGICVTMIFAGVLFSFVGSYADGSYDRCMKECVLPDKSNYSECSLSVCDFPI